MFDRDFGVAFAHEAFELLSPLDEQNALCIHQIVQGQGIEFALGIDAVEIDVVETDFRAAVFVDKSKRGTGHVVGAGGLKSFGNTLDQRRLACAKVSAQQDNGAGLDFLRKLTA